MVENIEERQYNDLTHFEKMQRQNRIDLDILRISKLSDTTKAYFSFCLDAPKNVQYNPERSKNWITRFMIDNHLTFDEIECFCKNFVFSGESLYLF